MSLGNVKTQHRISFDIPRYTDEEIVRRIRALAAEGGYDFQRATYTFMFSDVAADLQGVVVDADLLKVLELETVATRTMSFYFREQLRIYVNRDWDNSAKKLNGSLDSISISPEGTPQSVSPHEMVKLIALARKHFEPLDNKPFHDFLDEGAKELYRSREADLGRLEGIAEGFFEKLTAYSLAQKKSERRYRQRLATSYAERSKQFDEVHQKRMAEIDEREAALTELRQKLDERQNQQARRDTYKEFKKKLDDQSKKFELSEGTQGRRVLIYWFIGFLLLLVLGVFGYCFTINVIRPTEKINWIAVGTQIGSAIAFIAIATFAIRWQNRWFQKHADEEFQLKRLDLDIDRATWLVELSLEWENMAKGPIPPELVEKLSRSLFVPPEGGPDIDIHPAETLFSAALGKDGKISLEPGKVALRRTDHPTARKRRTDGGS